jgi:1,2-diacylglycerol 3-alpha-glucosyltransferase
LRIALLVPNFAEHDGSARVAELQALDLARRGHAVTVVALGGNIRPPRGEYRVCLLGMPRGLLGQRIYRLLFPVNLPATCRWVKRLREFDELIVHLYPLTWLAYWTRRLYGTRYVFWYHGIMDPRFFPYLYERLYIRAQIFLTKLTVRNADRAVAVSEFAAAELRSYTGLDATVEYNRVDDCRFHPGVPGEVVRKRFRLSCEPLILFVGALRPVKGVFQLIQAFQLVRRSIPRARLLVIGTPDYRYYYRRLKSAGGDGVTFVGFVPHAELPFYYAACDLYASCSFWETFNLPLWEAEAVGKPAVVFDIPPHRERKGPERKLVRTGDLEEFARACVRILTKTGRAGGGGAAP